jgi:hypothetical protein
LHQTARKSGKHSRAGDEPKRVRREDIIADRKGRQIPVTRTHTEKTERPAPPPKRGKPPRRDRTQGPRPARPR